MWPFKKKPTEAVAPAPETVYELIYDEHYPAGDFDYEIQVGILGQEDRFRVYYHLTRPIWSGVQVIPRQHPMTRERALELAKVWRDTLKATYEASLTQFNEDNQ